MKKNEFRVMNWLRKIREKQAAELQGMSAQERAAYFRRKAQELKNEQQDEKIAA